MKSSSGNDKTLEQASKRKARRTTSSSTELPPAKSMMDPKILKQLLKNNKKHNIAKVIEELKEYRRNGIGQPTTSRIKRSCSDRSMQIEENKYHIEVPSEFEKKFITDFQDVKNIVKGFVEKSNPEKAKLFNYTEQNYDRKAEKLLAKLYYLCEENFLEANAIQLWKDLPKFFDVEELNLMEGNPKEYYQKHLFIFDRYNKHEHPKRNLHKILKLKPEFLKDPTIKYAAEGGQSGLTQEFFEETAKCHSLLLKDFVNLLGIDPELYRIETINKLYPDQGMVVYLQVPDYFGFNPDEKTKNKNFDGEMTVREYFKYQRECMIEMPQYIQDEEGKIKFCISIDMGGWEEHLQHYQEKIPPQWLYNSNTDALQYLPEKIIGVNQPQMNLKVEGAWTGGHEEDLRLQMVNLNHGPDSNMWYVINPDQVSEYRRLVTEIHKVDIYKNEHEWFGDVDFCLQNGIEIQYFIQEPGDIVILGPGCLHWVRSVGITMNTAWNNFVMSLFQFQTAFERFKINEEIDCKHTIVPLKRMTFEVLSNQTFKLESELQKLLVQMVCEFLNEELQTYQEFKKDHPALVFEYEPKDLVVENCVNENCGSENFCFYAYCKYCSQLKKSEKVEYFLCLKCFDDHRKECKNKKKEVSLYWRYSDVTVKEILNLIENLNERKSDIEPSQNLAEFVKVLVQREQGSGAMIEEKKEEKGKAEKKNKGAKEKKKMNEQPLQEEKNSEMIIEETQPELVVENKTQEQIVEGVRQNPKEDSNMIIEEILQRIDEEEEGDQNKDAMEEEIPFEPMVVNQENEKKKEKYLNVQEKDKEERKSDKKQEKKKTPEDKEEKKVNDRESRESKDRTQKQKDRHRERYEEKDHEKRKKEKTREEESKRYSEKEKKSESKSKREPNDSKSHKHFEPKKQEKEKEKDIQKEKKKLTLNEELNKQKEIPSLNTKRPPSDDDDLDLNFTIKKKTKLNDGQAQEKPQKKEEKNEESKKSSTKDSKKSSRY